MCRFPHETIYDACSKHIVMRSACSRQVQTGYLYRDDINLYEPYVRTEKYIVLSRLLPGSETRRVRVGVIEYRYIKAAWMESTQHTSGVHVRQRQQNPSKQSHRSLLFTAAYTATVTQRGTVNC